jgi:hypothetical protein
MEGRSVLSLTLVYIIFLVCSSQQLPDSSASCCSHDHGRHRCDFFIIRKDLGKWGHKDMDVSSTYLNVFNGYMKRTYAYNHVVDFSENYRYFYSSLSLVTKAGYENGSGIRCAK